VKLIWTPRALERIIEIADIIAQERPEAAHIWVAEVFEVVERLEHFPRSGRRVPEVHREDVREVLHGDYRIIYRCEAHQLSVLTVRHARQLTRREDVP
jgi:toxin ParE1/3/4